MDKIESCQRLISVLEAEVEMLKMQLEAQKDNLKSSIAQAMEEGESLGELLSLVAPWLTLAQVEAAEVSAHLEHLVGKWVVRSKGEGLYKGTPEMVVFCQEFSDGPFPELEYLHAGRFTDDPNEAVRSWYEVYTRK